MTMIRTELSKTRTKDLSSRTEIMDFLLGQHLSCNKHKSFEGTGVVRFVYINAIGYLCCAGQVT